MKYYFTAVIHWLPYEEGGRKKIPHYGVRYCPLLRINLDNSIEDWSIDFFCPEYPKIPIIKFCFVADDAPYEKIQLKKHMNYLKGIKKLLE